MSEEVEEVQCILFACGMRENQTFASFLNKKIPGPSDRMVRCVRVIFEQYIPYINESHTGVLL